MKIKICGMRRQQDLDHAARLGVDFCGFIFHRRSPRYLEPDAARRLDSGAMLRTGVFVEQDAAAILAIMKLARLDFVQLHGNQTAADALRIGKERVIRTFWPARYASPDALASACADFPCAAVLLDAGEKGGGSGECLAWGRLGKICLPRPWFLAGGLNGSNVRTALGACAPDGVDFNSGLESAPGCKDSARMVLAVQALKEMES